MRLRPLLVAVATLAVYIAFAAPAGAFRAPDHDVDYETVPAIGSTVYFHRAAEIASDPGTMTILRYIMRSLNQIRTIR